MKQKTSSTTPPPDQNVIQSRHIGFIVMLVSLFLLGAVLGLRQINSPDLGFHLQSARWILENGRIPSKDIFTYTVPGNTYIDLQWIYQLVVYAMESLSGPAGIVILTTVLTLAFSATLLIRVKRQMGRIPLPAIFMLILFFLGNNWEVRPHLFSWIWGSLILLVLEEHNRGNRRWLFLLPVLMLLWVNSHSLYVLGLITIATYVFSDLVKSLLKHRRLKVDRHLMLWAIAALVACLANPYHIKGLEFPISQFFLIQGSAGYKSTLSGTAEFLSPFRFQEYFIEGKFVLFQPMLWQQLFTVLAVAGMIGARKSARLAEWILFAGFLYIFNQANKNFGYFTMACFPIVVAGLSQLGSKLNRPTGAMRGKGLIPYAATSLLCLLLAVGAGSGWLYDLGWQGAVPGLGYDPDYIPTGACKFITDHGIKGRIINCWDDGGYIGWTTKQKVFINSEGNTIGLKFYDEYVDAREPQGFPGALAKWKPTIALVRYQNTPFWLYYLGNVARNDWRMAYADESVALFLHNSISPEIPAMPRPSAGKDYPVYDGRAIEAVIDRAIQNGGPGFAEWIRGRAAYPIDEIKRSAFYLQTSELNACIGTSVAGLEKAGFIVPELMLDLGHALNARKAYPLADRCYDAYLSVDDNPVIAREIAMQRNSRGR